MHIEVQGIVGHICNPSTWDTETGRLYRLKTSLGYIVRLSLKANKEKEEAEVSH